MRRKVNEIYQSNNHQSCVQSPGTHLRSAFYPSTFIYYRFPPKIQLFYRLLSLASLWGAPWWASRRKFFFRYSNRWKMHFQHFFQLQKQRRLDIKLYIDIKSPNNVLIYTNTQCLDKRLKSGAFCDYTQRL